MHRTFIPALSIKMVIFGQALFSATLKKICTMQRGQHFDYEDIKDNVTIQKKFDIS